MNTEIKRLGVGPRMSEIAVHNGTIYLAGQVADKSAGQGIAAQTKEVLGMIDALLAQAGSDKSKLLHCQIFISDMADFAAMNTAWDQWVTPGHTPPRATVEAALARPGWLIEMVVIAAV